MKSFFLFLFFSLLALNNFAQTDSVSASHTSPMDSIKKKPHLDSKEEKETFSIDLTLNNWMNVPSGVEVKTFSPGIDFNYFYDLNLIKNNFSFAPGLSLSFTNYYTNASYNINDTLLFTSIAKSPEDYKVRTTYLEIPVELRLRTNLNKHGNRFKVAIGMRGGLLIGDFWKYKIEDSHKSTVIVKTRNIDNITKWRYGVTGRIGYGVVSLYGYYSLKGFFEDFKGSDITPYAVGITISAF